MALNARLFGAETVDVETDQWNGTCDTFSLVTANLNKFTLNGYRVLTTQDLPFATGVTTLGPVGSNPNANAGLISGNTLTLEPASSSFPGVVTTGAQTFTGAKTFTDNMVGNGSLRLGSVLQLPATSSSTTGNINQGGAAIFHTYGTNSVWAGTGAGQGFSQTGSGNSGFGTSAMQALTTGGNNTGIGYTSGQSLSTGNGNAMLGANSGKALSVGSGNCLMGQNAALNATSLSNSIVIGNNAGTSFASEVNAVCIDPDQSAGFLGSNSVNIGSSSATKCRIGGIYGATAVDTPIGVDSTTQLLGPLAYNDALVTQTATLDSGTITTMTVNGASTTTVQLKMLKSGKSVTMRLVNFSLTAQSGAALTLNFGTLPSTYWPVHALSFLVTIVNNSVFSNAVVYITAGGIVTLQLLTGAAFVLPLTTPYDYCLTWVTN